MPRVKKIHFLLLVVFLSVLFLNRSNVSETRLSTSRIKEVQTEAPNLYQYVSKQVQDRIYELQHPADCSEVRLLIYDVSTQRCDFACTLHQLCFYFEVAMETNRTVILQNTKLALSFFKPYVSDSCRHWEKNISIKDIGIIHELKNFSKIYVNLPFFD